MKYLIINADDFGLTPGVNRGILKSIREGIVTSTTVMINSRYLEELPEVLEAGGGVGLHFNLTWGPPVSPPDTVASLVDEEGLFRSDPSFGVPESGRSIPITAGQTRRAIDIQRELEAQVEKFLRLVKRLPTHIDVHKHAHKYPVVLAPLMVVAGRLGLPVREISPEMQAILRENRLLTTDFFMGGASPEGPYWMKARLLSALAGVQPGVTEIMCHPGYVPEPIPGMFYNHQREVELTSFCDPETREAVRNQGIELVDFSYLRKKLGPDERD